MRQRHAGFTLIELVIVIVILGILAATALPRFVSLTDEARTAARAGTAGGINSAIAIAHAKWLVLGATPGGSVTLEGGSPITMNNSGYPAIASTTYDSDSECQALMNSLLGSTTGLSVAYAASVCTVTGTPTPYATAISVTPTGAS